MLDFRMETFLTVCKYMNFTHAAEALHLTQPAVSQHIRYLLENMLSFPPLPPLSKTILIRTSISVMAIHRLFLPVFRREVLILPLWKDILWKINTRPASIKKMPILP